MKPKVLTSISLQTGLGGNPAAWPGRGSLTEYTQEANRHSVCHQEEVCLADSQDECGMRHSKLMSSKPFFNKPNNKFHVCVYFTVSQLKGHDLLQWGRDRSPKFDLVTHLYHSKLSSFVPQS